MEHPLCLTPSCLLLHLTLCRLVTWGQNHIKFWDLSADPRDPSGTALSCATHSGSFSASTQTHTVLSACYLPSGVVLSGKGQGGGWGC